MLIFGVDFSSAPSRKKPIVCACCRLTGSQLRLSSLQPIPKLSDFDSFLAQSGPWLAAIDAPLGQARQLIVDLQLSHDWSAYVQQLGQLSRQDFVNLMNGYRSSRPSGHKEPKRQVDILAKAQSPMKVYGIPVGRMFHCLAPRLAATTLNLPGLRPTTDSRTVVEAYPALVVRKLNLKSSYKSDNLKQDSVYQHSRARIVAALGELEDWYQLRLELSPTQRESLIADPSGDSLDALLAAMQAAWAQQQSNYGIPEDTDGLEGWIADPELYR